MVFVVILVVYLLPHAYNCVLLFEGDNCTVPATNENGHCINIHKCESAKVMLQQKQNPQFCGFNGNIPLVCCPSHQSLESGTLSQEMCNKYFDVKFQVFAIDLGMKALAKEFPHMAAIGYGNNANNILWLCGGTLISHYFVLTAAHCAESAEYGPAQWVRLGDLDLQNTTEEANVQDIRISQIYTHPLYNPPSHYHDIALFRFENRTLFIPYFKPACLHFEKNIPVETLQITGWGKQGFLGETSSHLLKADIKLVDHEICARKYSDVSKRKLKNGIIDEIQLCAGDAEGRDTCPGDSGGPLHYFVKKNEKLSKHFVIVGITSFGKGCGGANTAGVYTRVSAYVEWIESIVWNNGYD